MIENTSTLYKMIILYMLKKVTFPLSNSQITNFLLDHEYTTYFHIQQTIHDLMDTHLILERKQGNSICYEITPEGQKTLSYFEKNMSDSIRLEVDSYILEKGYEMRNENSITAEYYRTPEQEYTVQLGVLEKNAPLIQLKITVPTEEKKSGNLCIGDDISFLTCSVHSVLFFYSSLSRKCRSLSPACFS